MLYPRFKGLLFCAIAKIPLVTSNISVWVVAGGFEQYFLVFLYGFWIIQVSDRRLVLRNALGRIFKIFA